MPKAYLSVGDDNYIAEVDHQAFRDVMDRVGDRCSNEECGEYIYDCSKMRADGKYVDRTYSFSTCHVPHLLRALLLTSIIISATFVSHDNLRSVNVDELITISRLISVVAQASDRKESFKIYIR